MIKCLKCNTLYSESAKVCLYCKIPLEVSNQYDEKIFNFKMKEFTTEAEAQNFKINLLASDVPCVVKKEGDKFYILISDQSKKDAFKLKSDAVLVNSLEKGESGSKKITIYIAIVLGIVILLFLYYFSQTTSKLYIKSNDSDIKIIGEDGTVDPNIADRISTAEPSTNKDKKKGPSPVIKDKKEEGKPEVKNKQPAGK